MRFKDFAPLSEGAFDNMANTLGNLPKKSPGRWPAGSKSVRDQEQNKGTTVSEPGATKHKAGSNYSGDRAHERDSHHNVVPRIPQRKELDQLKGPPRK